MNASSSHHPAGGTCDDHDEFDASHWWHVRAPYLVVLTASIVFLVVIHSSARALDSTAGFILQALP
jgi:hypothetical protein